MRELVEERVKPSGKIKLIYNFHRGQRRAWRSDKRVVAIISGTQGGKTSFGPLWLHREIQKRGPGDYMVIAPTYKLMRLKAMPEFRRHFEQRLQLGEYHAGESTFNVTADGDEKLFGQRQEERTRVMFGHATDPESLEAATAKAIWADEAGQNKFKLGSYEALMRRLALHRGRMLITTTPYNFGWLKTKIYDPWRAGSEDIEVVRFESIQNPMFSRREWERAKQELPKWKFDMFYRAVFTRPAGMVYDSFVPDRDVIEPFEIPDHWQRFWGFDFGGANTVCLCYARPPDEDVYYLYREYHAGNLIETHAKYLLSKEPRRNIMSFGGSPGEGQWRSEFRKYGINIKQPKISDPEINIARVYAMHRAGKIKVFKTCEGYLIEKEDYSREVDEAGNVMDAIKNKSDYHHMDAEKYVMGSVTKLTSGDWAELAEAMEEEEQWI